MEFKNQDHNMGKDVKSVNQIISIVADKVKTHTINNQTKQLQKLTKTTKAFLKLGRTVANLNYLEYLTPEGIKF